MLVCSLMTKKDLFSFASLFVFCYAILLETGQNYVNSLIFFLSINHNLVDLAHKLVFQVLFAIFCLL